MKHWKQYPIIAIVFCLVGTGCSTTPRSQESAASACSARHVLGSNSSLKDCSPDEDKDGIADVIDACLQTPADAVVDRRGCIQSFTPPAPTDCHTASAQQDRCAEPQLFVISDWIGDQNKISPRALTVLKNAVQLLNSNPATVALIEGHSDSKLSATYNYRLGLKRALIVRDALLEEGVSAHRISTRSLGEARPRDDNSSASGRAQNRRVEIHIAASFDALLPRGQTCDREQDGDCDGVINEQDRCLSSPPNMPVSKQGCLKET